MYHKAEKETIVSNDTQQAGLECTPNTAAN